MSLAETFLNTAKDVLIMAENIKRLDARIDNMTSDLSGLDRRVMRIEVMIDLANNSPARRGPASRGTKGLP